MRYPETGRCWGPCNQVEVFWAAGDLSLMPPFTMWPKITSSDADKPTVVGTGMTLSPRDHTGTDREEEGMEVNTYPELYTQATSLQSYVEEATGSTTDERPSCQEVAKALERLKNQ